MASEKLLLDALDQLGYGGIILDSSEQPLLINQSALHIVNGDRVPAASPQDPNWQAMVTGSFLYNGGLLRFRLDEDGWVVVPRLDSDPNRPLILWALPTEERGARPSNRFDISRSRHIAAAGVPIVAKDLWTHAQ
jgi:hypothetical protein